MDEKKTLHSVEENNGLPMPKMVESVPLCGSMDRGH